MGNGKRCHRQVVPCGGRDREEALGFGNFKEEEAVEDEEDEEEGKDVGNSLSSPSLRSTGDAASNDVFVKEESQAVVPVEEPAGGESVPTRSREENKLHAASAAVALAAVVVAVVLALSVDVSSRPSPRKGNHNPAAALVVPSPGAHWEGDAIREREPCTGEEENSGVSFAASSGGSTENGKGAAGETAAPPLTTTFFMALLSSLPTPSPSPCASKGGSPLGSSTTSSSSLRFSVHASFSFSLLPSA